METLFVIFVVLVVGVLVFVVLVVGVLVVGVLVTKTRKQSAEVAANDRKKKNEKNIKK